MTYTRDTYRIHRGNGFIRLDPCSNVLHPSSYHLYTLPHWAPSVVLVTPLSSTNFTFIAYRCRTSWMQCILHSTRMFLQVSRSRERSSQNLTKKSSKRSLGYLLKSIVFGWWRWSMENTQFSKFYLAMIHMSALVVLDINMGYSMIHALGSFVRCVV